MALWEIVAKICTILGVILMFAVTAALTLEIVGAVVDAKYVLALVESAYYLYVEVKEGVIYIVSLRC